MKNVKRQFGLGTMLFATLCIAGVLAGYRYGRATKDSQIFGSTVSVVNYDVHELVDYKSDQTIDAQLSVVCKLVIETVQPDSWQNEGRDIFPYPANVSIVVRQSGSCHAAIADLFEQLRTLKKRA